MMARRPLVAGNWKMNGLEPRPANWKRSSPERDAELRQRRPDGVPAGDPDRALRRGRPRIAASPIGGQDCHALPAGAYTGDISAEMLADAGATAVIVGHSERRHYHGETDAAVRAKALAARRAGLLAIVCVGETRAERDAGQAR